MAGRNKLFKDEVSLAKALDVFWQYGYEASSLQMLLEAMELNKGSLYHTFGSKKELFIKVLEQYSQSQLRFLEQNLRSDKNVIVSIQNTFRSLINESNENFVYRGCLLVNTLGEVSIQHPSIREIAAHKLRMLEEMFLKHLNIAKHKGNIGSKIPTGAMAKHLILVWSGIHINRKIYPAAGELEVVLENNLAVLNQFLL